jgi:quercetin dioxygenase-like cupin family protein
MAHAFQRIEDGLFTLPAFYRGNSDGFRRADLIGREQGSVHMGFFMSELAPGGEVSACIHSFEKGILVTEGEVELNRDGKTYRLGWHDYALIPVGTAHAFRNRGAKPARWIEKCAPRPKLDDEWQDSFFPPSLAWPDDGAASGATTPLARMIGHFDKSQLPPAMRVDDFMWGWSKKMLMDQMFGSEHFNLFIIEFADGGQTSLHDHNFEEAYLVLDGEVTFEAEGKRYVLTPGTIAWSGVGAPHAFFMDRGTSCCWLEVMSPQPPLQNANRRYATWDRIRARLTG